MRGMWNGRVRRVSLAAILLLAAACTSAVDIKQAVQVTDLSSGWYDAGIVDGKNKLVPSVTFKLRKPADTNLSTVSLNIVYRKVSGEEHDDVFVQRVDFNGNETEAVTVRSQSGYTGDPPQSRADMLKHANFVDMEVEIFGRQTSSRWVSLHKATVTRQLLTN